MGPEPWELRYRIKAELCTYRFSNPLRGLQIVVDEKVKDPWSPVMFELQWPWKDNDGVGHVIRSEVSIDIERHPPIKVIVQTALNTFLHEVVAQGLLRDGRPIE